MPINRYQFYFYHQIVNMIRMGLFVLIAIASLSIAFCEPVQYRQNQSVRPFGNAKPVDASAVEKAEDAPYPPGGQGLVKKSDLPKEWEEEKSIVLPSEVEIQTEDGVETTENPTTTEQTNEVEEGRSNGNNGPYPPLGWKPQGTLFVLPLDFVPAETTTETADDDNEATTTLPEETVEAKDRDQANRGRPYPASGWKPSGQLLLLPNEQETLAESSPAATNSASEQENNENDEKEGTTTNPNTSTDKPSADIETTSEPDAEAVDVNVNTGNNNLVPNTPPVIQAAAVPGSYFVQLPNGSLQRIVYLTSPLITSAAVSPAVAVATAPIATANVQYQQLIQTQPIITTSNSVAAPRVALAYTTQYQTW